MKLKVGFYCYCRLCRCCNCCFALLFIQLVANLLL